MVVVLINVTIFAVQTCFVQSKIVKQFAFVQVNSNLFRAMLKMVVFVIYMPAQQITTAQMEFVVAANVL